MMPVPRRRHESSGHSGVLELQRREPGIQAAGSHQFGMGPLVPPDDRDQAPECVPPVCTVDSRCAMTSVVRPAMTASSAACTMRSLRVSSALVASSNSRRRISSTSPGRWRYAGAVRHSAACHAGPARCRNLPANMHDDSWANAPRAASSTSARAASGRPYRILSSTLPEKIAASCGTRRCAHAVRPASWHGSERHRSATGPVVDHKSAATAGTRWFCRHRWGRQAQPFHRGRPRTTGAARRVSSAARDR